MLKQIIIIFLHVTLAAMQSDPTIDDDDSYSSEVSSSDYASADVDIPTASIPSTSTSSPSEEASLWTMDILNYSAVCTLYENNVYYLNSTMENVKMVFHYLVARFFSLFTLIPNPAAESTGNHVFKTRTSSSALTYHLYTLQTILFRTETIAIICVLFILILFLRSLIHYRERSLSTTTEDSPTYPLSTPTTSKSYYIISKVMRYLNFTILFTNLLTFVDGLLPLKRTSESIIIQNSYGHAAVYSLQGRRPNMEDTFTLKNNVAKDFGIDYYAVYDGHGGQSAALYSEKEIFDGVTKRIKEILTESNKENNDNAKSDSCPASQSPNKSVPSSPSKETFSESSSSSPSIFASSLTNHKSCPASSKPAASRFDSITVNAMKNILHEEITKLDKKLVEEFRRKSDISGSTAILAIRLVHSNILLVANVGDSRAILCDWKGATIPLSFDHKPYQLKEYRRIVEAGGYIMLKGVYRVNGILAVSRALGDYPLKEDRLVIPDPDILSFDLNELKPKFMVVASDGFWDTFSNDDAVRFVRNELVRYTPNYAESQANLAMYIAKKLVNEAYTRESYDNITVIVVLFEDTPATGGSAKIGQAKSSPTKPKPLGSASS